MPGARSEHNRRPSQPAKKERPRRAIIPGDDLSLGPRGGGEFISDGTRRFMESDDLDYYVENSDSQTVPEVESNEIYSDLVGQKREFDGSIYDFSEIERPADIESEIENENLGGYGEEGVFTDYLRPGESVLPENESDEELHLGYEDESEIDRAMPETAAERNRELRTPRRRRSQSHRRSGRQIHRPASRVGASPYSPADIKRTDHSGKGPKGYRRSDRRIEEEINERLTFHPYIDASDVQVSVDHGEVTLSGTAPDKRSKRLAEDTAYMGRGVQEVHNRIKIQR